MIVPPGLSSARPLGVLDHLDRHAVLDRVAGIERLELGEHRGLDEPRVMRLMRTIGVWPMASRMVSADLLHVKIMSHCPSFETNLNPDADDVHTARQAGSRASVPIFLSLEDWMSRLRVATVTLAVVLAA